MDLALKEPIPAIELKPRDPDTPSHPVDLSLDGTRISGRPDLPAGMEWPRLALPAGAAEVYD